MYGDESVALLTVADLKARGWSQRLVGRFLGDPDSYSNPGFKAGRPARLYAIARVRQVELRQPEFALERQRSVAAARRLDLLAQQKQRGLMEVAASINLPPLVMPYSTLLSSVSKSAAGSESGTEQRLALRQLLGTMKLLEAPLNLYSWNSGVCEARLVFRNRVLDHILERYQSLAVAVATERQLLHGERCQDW